MTHERHCLPVAEWPDGDRLHWSEGTRRLGLFDDAGAGADWSPRSRRKAEFGYGRWLAWLRSAGLLDVTGPPAARVARSRVADYVAELATACAPYTQVCRIQELYDALRVLAPEDDWRWLAELLMTLRRRAVPVSNKRMRLRPARELAELGRRLMTEAEDATGWSARRRAVHYRDGLAIALLAYRPVRLTNLASVRIGRQLVKHENRWWLVFPEGEVKTGRRYEAAFPAALVPALEHYLARHRPVLLAGEGGREAAVIDALWVSEVGTMLEKGALATRIRKHTKSTFGAAVPPHWFRDAAATSIAVEDPRHVRDAHHVLCNSLAMTEKHYNQARSLEASRRHHAMLAGLRASLKKTTTT